MRYHVSKLWSSLATHLKSVSFFSLFKSKTIKTLLFAFNLVMRPEIEYLYAFYNMALLCTHLTPPTSNLPIPVCASRVFSSDSHRVSSHLKRLKILHNCKKECNIYLYIYGVYVSLWCIFWKNTLNLNLANLNCFSTPGIRYKLEKLRGFFFILRQFFLCHDSFPDLTL